MSSSDYPSQDQPEPDHPDADDDEKTMSQDLPVQTEAEADRAERHD